MPASAIDDDGGTGIGDAQVLKRQIGGRVDSVEKERGVRVVTAARSSGGAGEGLADRCVIVGEHGNRSVIFAKPSDGCGDLEGCAGVEFQG